MEKPIRSSLFTFSQVGNFQPEDINNFAPNKQLTINSSDPQQSGDQTSRSKENFYKEDPLEEKDSIPLLFEFFEQFLEKKALYIYLFLAPLLLTIIAFQGKTIYIENATSPGVIIFVREIMTIVLMTAFGYCGRSIELDRFGIYRKT